MALVPFSTRRAVKRHAVDQVQAAQTAGVEEAGAAACGAADPAAACAAEKCDGKQLQQMRGVSAQQAALCIGGWGAHNDHPTTSGKPINSMHEGEFNYEKYKYSYLVEPFRLCTGGD